MVELIGSLGQRMSQRWLTGVFVPGLLYCCFCGWLAVGPSDPLHLSQGIRDVNDWWQGLPQGPVTIPLVAVLAVVLSVMFGYAAEALGHEGIHRLWVARGPSRWRAYRRRRGQDPASDSSYQVPDRATSVGDAFRLVGVRVYAEYRLPVTDVWPRIWLIASPETRALVTSAAARYYADTVLAAWGIAYLLWALHWWPAGPIGLIVAAVAYLRARSSAAALAAVVEAVVDTNLGELAKSLRVDFHGPRPAPETAALIRDILTKGSART
ncbi:hypothetical protein [Dactylosporangium sp. NPDC005555]|uniref:hypothetical protein n=1 Tax=Dactylosporangium sp. NPDC005555 TaxID=3154889 RepID=UPI0033AC1DC0